MACKTTKKIQECPKCGHSLKRIKFANETKAQITCPDCGWRKSKVQMAIAILFYDVRLEGIEAIVAIKDGETAEQTFEAYCLHAAKEQGVPEDEAADFSKSYGFEEMPITNL